MLKRFEHFTPVPVYSGQTHHVFYLAIQPIRPLPKLLTWSFKMNELILMHIDTTGLWGKNMKRSTFGVTRSKVKFTQD